MPSKHTRSKVLMSKEDGLLLLTAVIFSMCIRVTYAWFFNKKKYKIPIIFYYAITQKANYMSIPQKTNQINIGLVSSYSDFLIQNRKKVWGFKFNQKCYGFVLFCFKYAASSVTKLHVKFVFFKWINESSVQKK